MSQEAELRDKILKLNKLIASKKKQQELEQKQSQVELQRQIQQQKLKQLQDQKQQQRQTIVSITSQSPPPPQHKPIFKKPPFTTPSPYKSKPSIFPTPIPIKTGSVIFNKPQTTTVSSPSLSHSPIPIKTGTVIFNKTQITPTSSPPPSAIFNKSINKAPSSSPSSPPIKTGTVIFNRPQNTTLSSSSSPSIVNIINASPSSPKSTTPTSNSNIANQNVIFSGYNPNNNKIIKTNTPYNKSVFKPYSNKSFRPLSTISISKMYNNNNRLSKFNIKQQQQQQLQKLLLYKQLQNNKLILGKLKKNTLQSSTSKPKIIDSVFIKKGNSLVRKELDNKYITIGNKLIRQESLNNNSNNNSINSPSPTKIITPATIKINKKPIIKIRNNNINNKKISEKIKEAIERKKIKNDNNLKKKSYCLFYTRFGKCNNGEKCRYEHDPSRVRVCNRFISAGGCDDSECKLRHPKDLDLEQMPICHLYLKGVCWNDPCPYLHVKFSKDTEICPDFLNGYCPNGSKCNLQHIYINSKKKKENKNIDDNIDNSNIDYNNLDNSHKIQEKVNKRKKGQYRDDNSGEDSRGSSENEESDYDDNFLLLGEHPRKRHLADSQSFLF